MEHMKRMVFVIVALVAAGAALMYVHKNMYKSCDSQDVKVQSMSQYENPKTSEGKSYDQQHRAYEKNLHRSKSPTPTPQ